MLNAYNQKGFSLLPYIVPENQSLKQMVGEFIYPYVEKLVGDANAPKITGMLIELPLEEIKQYLYDANRFYIKVGEAVNLLQSMVPQQH